MNGWTKMFEFAPKTQINYNILTRDMQLNIVAEVKYMDKMYMITIF